MDQPMLLVWEQASGGLSLDGHSHRQRGPVLENAMYGVV